jgi:hypothetical protein
VFIDNLTISTKCAQTIHRLLTRRTVFKNKSLYYSLRSIYLKKENLIEFEKFEPDLKQSLLCIASLNSNGYVREEALDRLLKNSNQFTFPFILFRLSDWVPVIKSKAQNGIRLVIQKEEPEFLIKNHKTIDWLLKVERTNLKHIHNEITEFIFSDINIEKILKSLNRYSDGDRFFIFRNIFGKKKLQTASIEKILSDKNHLIRLLAIRNIEVIDNQDIVIKLLCDKSQKIRQYALNKIPFGQWDDFKKEIYPLIFDSSSGIRASARIILSKSDTYDYPQIYKEAIKRKPSVGCVVGLSEVGVKKDVEIIEIFLKASIIKFRASSLYAISILDYEKAKQLAFDLLSDISNAVKRTASIIIQKETSIHDLEKLRNIYKSGDNETKSFVLKVISKYGGWSIAGDFIIGISEADKKLREISQFLLISWYKYSIGLATTKQDCDRNYVVGIYEKTNFNELELPTNINKILTEIPFIFGVSKK